MRKLIFFFCFSLSTSIFGQFKEPKFGKIEIPDLVMNKYDRDTTADALMLFDNGISYFKVNKESKFQFVYERHFRIKIFKKSSYHLSDFRFRLFRNSINEEKLTNIKAATYNLVDGKMITTELNTDLIYKTEGKYFYEKMFSFPDVKEGSIIELSYSVTSDFFYNLRGWNFQHEYPVLWSQYKYIIPEYFDYRRQSKGYLPFDVNINESNKVTYTIHPESNIISGLGGGYYDIRANTFESTLAIANVPTFVPEPNINCEKNYIQSIEFELATIQFPNQPREDYTKSWKSVNHQMNEDDNFGLLLKSKSFIIDTVAKICLDSGTELEKAKAIYNYVQNRIKWNENYSLFAFNGLKEPFLNRSGNSSEINLLLIMMLREAGLKSDPVMFSTRDNGISLTYYPTISNFNSVLAKVEIGGKTVLLDAINKFCPFGVLDANDINGSGRVVNKLEGDWVDLSATEKHKITRDYKINIAPDGKLNGTMIGTYDGYAAISYRKNLSTESSMDDYIRKIQEGSIGLTINKYSVSNIFNNYLPIIDTFQLVIIDQTDIIGDKILIRPLLFESTIKNNYLIEERKYPVDYNFPVEEVILFEYSIPPGYEIESLPQSILLRLEDNSMSISYSIQNLGNIIIIAYKKKIQKILFLAEEYPDLKEMYNQIVKKHAEQIILKRVT